MSDSNERLKRGEKLTAIEWELVPTEDDYRMDRLDFPPKLLNRFTFLYNFVGSADAKPTDGSFERFEDLKPELAKRVARLQEVIETELPAFDTLILKSDVAPVIVTEKSSADVGH